MSAKKDAETQTQAETVKNPDTQEEMVTAVYPRAVGDKDRFITVGLNGKMYTVERGKKVTVPSGVDEIIRHSTEQDVKAQDLIDELEGGYEVK